MCAVCCRATMAASAVYCRAAMAAMASRGPLASAAPRRPPRRSRAQRPTAAASAPGARRSASGVQHSAHCQRRRGATRRGALLLARAARRAGYSWRPAPDPPAPSLCEAPAAQQPRGVHLAARRGAQRASRRCARGSSCCSSPATPPEPAIGDGSGTQGGAAPQRAVRGGADEGSEEREMTLRILRSLVQVRRVRIRVCSDAPLPSRKII